MRSKKSVVSLLNRCRSHAHFIICVVLAVGFIFGFTSLSLSAAPSAEVSVEDSNASSGTEESGDIDSDDIPNLMGGSLSAHNQILVDDRPKRGFFRYPTPQEPWDNWKRELKGNTGVGIGGSYGLLYQGYSDNPRDIDEAFSHKFTFNLSADLIGRGTDSAGSLNIALEDRRKLGTDLPPLFAGVAAGSIIPTTGTWSDFGFGLTQLYWQQNLFQNRFQYAIGRIFAPNYVNAYPFFDDNRQFLNLAFSTSPTVASSLRGIGSVITVYPTESLYIIGGLYNANSEDTSNDLANFFEENEYFYQAEVGWTGNARRPVSVSGRGPTDTDNVHLTFWYKDEQVERGIPKSSGVAFNANYMVTESLMPFLRGGYSDGDATLVDANISAGLGYRTRGTDADLLGVAFGWARPSDSQLDNQYIIETFYRFQVTSNFALTPDLQLIVDPALSPEESTLWVGAIRARLTF
ncbi:MAG: carbohydrate porin [Desulfocapsaceae bacterium]